MSYSLAKIEKNLKVAYNRAKDQIKSKNTMFKASMFKDRGHKEACKLAASAIIQIKQHRMEGVQKDKDWYISAKDRKDGYKIFFFRAQLYLAYRGISPAALHKSAIMKNVKTRVTSSGVGSGSFLNPTGATTNVKLRNRPLRIIEEALNYAGVSLPGAK